jgi:hypothetical protein
VSVFQEKKDYIIYLKYFSIYRGGHHRYSIDAEGVSTTSKGIATGTPSTLRHHSG